MTDLEEIRRLLEQDPVGPSELPPALVELLRAGRLQLRAREAEYRAGLVGFITPHGASFRNRARLVALVERCVRPTSPVMITLRTPVRGALTVLLQAGQEVGCAVLGVPELACELCGGQVMAEVRAAVLHSVFCPAASPERRAEARKLLADLDQLRGGVAEAHGAAFLRALAGGGGGKA